MIGTLPTHYGRTNFYSVAAQVIPVLLLAIVFEQRLFRRREMPHFLAAWLSPIVIGSFVVAEAVSLRVLYRGYAHRQDQILVIGPMLVATVLLAVPIILPPILRLERAGKQTQMRIAEAITVAVATFIVLVLLALFSQ